MKKTILALVCISVIGVICFLVMPITAKPSLTASETIKLAPMKQITIEPIASLRHGLYFVRVTTKVSVEILGRKVVIAQISYIKLNSDQIKIVRERIKESN